MRIGDEDFASPFWSFVGNVQKLPAVLTFLNALQIGLLLIARVDVVPATVLALALIGSSVAGCWLYRRNRRSLKRIFLMFQLNGWPLAITLGEMMWTVSYLTGTHSLFADHLAMIAALIVAATGALTFYYVRIWGGVQDLYRQLGSHRGAGQIAESDALRILTFQGESTRMNQKLPVLVALASTLTMGASIYMGRSAVNIVLFVAITLMLCPYIAAVLLARILLQRRYLGDDDLLIVG